MKVYRVEGICMVPHEVSLNVAAWTKVEAIEKAQELFKANPRAHVVDASEDLNGACEWIPNAKELT